MPVSRYSSTSAISTTGMPIARDAPVRAEHAADQIRAAHGRVEQVVVALRTFARDRGLDEVAHAVELVRPVEIGEARRRCRSSC